MIVTKVLINIKKGKYASDYTQDKKEKFLLILILVLLYKWLVYKAKIQGEILPAFIYILCRGFLLF